MDIKKCLKCKAEKVLSDFNKKSSNKDGVQSECKICQGETSRARYKKNSKKLAKQINEAKKIRINENRGKYFTELCAPCLDCGLVNPFALEFDHKDNVNKVMGVSRMVGDGYSWKKIKEEIDKCEPRCSNCHKIRTAKQQGWYKDLVEPSSPFFKIVLA